MHYSAKTKGFYDKPENYKNAPDDLIEIKPNLYSKLISGQASGKVIVAGDDGIPCLRDPDPEVMTREKISEMRQRAYADPVTGSDRYFAESMREGALGNEEGAAAANQMGISRYNEIQEQLPWPNDEG